MSFLTTYLLGCIPVSLRPEQCLKIYLYVVWLKNESYNVQFNSTFSLKSIDRRMPQIPNFQLRISKMCLYINLRNCPLECAGTFLAWAIVVVPQSCLLNSQARTGGGWASFNFKREKKDVKKKVRGSGNKRIWKSEYAHFLSNFCFLTYSLSNITRPRRIF